MCVDIYNVCVYIYIHYIYIQYIKLNQLLPFQIFCPDPRREKLKDARQVLLEPEQYGSEIRRYNQLIYSWFYPII